MKTNIWMGTVAAMLLAVVPVRASLVTLKVDMTNPLLEAGATRTVVLKVALAAAERRAESQRPPVNMALVIDKSGSMQGERIRQAKLAALAAVDRLRDDDIISVVAFDNNVTVLVPATKASNRDAIRRGIEQIQAGGTTALFAGTSKGAAEVRKFLEREHVNRVILLSDGQANVGPRSPGALGELGASLMKDGISVTTIGLGLGYNEDLMVRLARESDGNHSFVEHPNDLVAIFDREFGEAMSVVAQDVEIRIDCGAGIRPLRTLGRPSEISGQTVITHLNQLYGGQERHLLLEVEVPAHAADAVVELASVTATFRDLGSNEQSALREDAQVQVTASREEAEASVNRAVMGAFVLQEAAVANEQAVQLRDEGRVEEARQVLSANVERLRQVAADEAMPAPARAQLEAFADDNVEDAEALEDSSSWGVRRKSMRESQYNIETQRYR
ncbi:MAG: vWA domain-containing protein [Kiritimatiellia bacterium]